MEDPHLRQTEYLAPQDEEKEAENDVWVKFRGFVHSSLFDVVLKISFILLCIPLVISTVFFSIFDTACSVYERASAVSNCTQSFFVAHPKQWISAWLMMSIISRCLFMFIIYLNHRALNFQFMKFKQIYKKGSFGSLLFLLITSLIYYFVRLIPSKTDGTSKFILVLLFLWAPFSALVVCCINYLPRVQLRERGAKQFTHKRKRRLEILRKKLNFFVHWFARVVYFFELICKNVAIMLGIAQDVEPFFENNFRKSYNQYWGLMAVISGFKLAFHARLLTFFWEKVFYGNKDLFSDPGDELVDEENSIEPG